MNLPIFVKSTDHEFTAALIGAPQICAVGPTREAAIAELRQIVRQRIDSGEIATLEFDEWLDLAGKYRDDPLLDEICQEAYQARDAELKP